MRLPLLLITALLMGVNGPAPGLDPAAQSAVVQGTVRFRGRPAVDAVVSLVSESATALPAPDGPYVMDQQNLRFIPRVLVIPVGSTVEFLNSDPLLHNVFSPSGDSLAFDLGTYPDGESREHTFDVPGTWVVLCQVHPEMVAYVVVVPTTYSAVTDERGTFRIEDVPAGAYVARVWHAKARTHEQPAQVPTTGSLTLDLSLAAR